jgi:hypothetical protein
MRAQQIMEHRALCRAQGMLILDSGSRQEEYLLAAEKIQVGLQLLFVRLAHYACSILKSAAYL